MSADRSVLPGAAELSSVPGSENSYNITYIGMWYNDQTVKLTSEKVGKQKNESKFQRSDFIQKYSKFVGKFQHLNLQDK